MFLWLMWDNKILTMDNLFDRGCNKLSTATCSLYHSDIEIVDHLFFGYSVASSTFHACHWVDATPVTKDRSWKALPSVLKVLTA